MRDRVDIDAQFCQPPPPRTTKAPAAGAARTKKAAAAPAAGRVSKAKAAAKPAQKRSPAVARGKGAAAVQKDKPAGRAKRPDAAAPSARGQKRKREL